MNDRSRPGESGSKTIAAVNTMISPAATASIAPAADFAPAYIAVLVDRFGTPRRRQYLNLHHASAAVQRARAQGREAWLILCELRPVASDLGSVTE